MMYRELLLSSALLCLHVIGTPQFFGHHGRRTCSHDLRHNVVMASESYAQPVHKPYITLCQGHRLCSTYKTTYSLAYRQVSRIASASHFYSDCCPGWRRLHSHNCNQALCAEPCANGGSCLKPNKCACPPGWSGPRCQTDVDECSGQQPCTQLCINTAGSYRCACREGFRLAGDGRSCQRRPSPTPAPTQRQPAAGGHTDAGKRALKALRESKPRAYLNVLQQHRGKRIHDQPRGPLLLLVRAMPLSTRTVSNNALRLVPTPDWCYVRPAPCGENGIVSTLIMTASPSFRSKHLPLIQTNTDILPPSLVSSEMLHSVLFYYYYLFMILVSFSSLLEVFIPTFMSRYVPKLKLSLCD